MGNQCGEKYYGSVGVAGRVKVAVRVVRDLEADLAADVVHGVVVAQHLSGNLLELLYAANLNEPSEEFRAETLAVPFVAQLLPDGGVLIVEPIWPPASSTKDTFLISFENGVVLNDDEAVRSSSKSRNLTRTDSPAA